MNAPAHDQICGLSAWPAPNGQLVHITHRSEPLEHMTPQQLRQLAYSWLAVAACAEAQDMALRVNEQMQWRQRLHQPTRGLDVFEPFTAREAA